MATTMTMIVTQAAYAAASASSSSSSSSRFTSTRIQTTTTAAQAVAVAASSTPSHPNALFHKHSQSSSTTRHYPHNNSPNLRTSSKVSPPGTSSNFCARASFRVWHLGLVRQYGEGLIGRAAKVYTVEMEHNGGTHILNVAEDETILSKAIDAGLDVPYDCQLGVCMTCPAKLEQGQVNQSEGMLSEDVKAKGYALMCASYPLSDCRIRSIPEDELLALQLVTASD